MPFSVLILFTFYVLDGWNVSNCCDEINNFSFKEVASISPEVIKATVARSRTDTNLFEGDVTKKSATAVTVAAEHIQLCGETPKIPLPVSYSINEEDSTNVGLLCHPDPMVILGEGLVVYVEKPTEANPESSEANPEPSA